MNTEGSDGSLRSDADSTDLSVNSSHKPIRRGWGQATLMLLAAIGCIAGGVLFGSCSFTDIEKMRQLERTPQVPNSSVITGEANLSGVAAEKERVLNGPDTGKRALYYHYTIEEERRDSDGNKKWHTVHNSSDSVDFYLYDETGGVIIGATDSGIEFEAPEKSQRRAGDRRYTEYRIDPGDEVFVFGYAERTDEGYRVGFEHDGAYYPLISSGSEQEQRFDRAVASGLFVVLGVAFLLFGVFFLLRLFRVHHTAIYLGCATAVVVMTLCSQGLMMMVADLQAADERAERTLDEGERVIDEILSDYELGAEGEFEELGSFDDSQYSELPDAERQRVSGIRMMMAQSVERTNNNLSRFPEMIVGPVVGAHTLDSIELPPEEQDQIQSAEEQHNPIRLGPLYGFLGIVIGVLGLALGTWNGIKTVGLKRTIENIPTTPTSGVVYGLTEITGQVEFCEPDQHLTGPYSKCPCVYYRYLIEEYRKTGKNSSWVTISDDTEMVPFYCRDESGRILVDPSGAEYLPGRKMVEKRGKRRYSEWIVSPNEPIYALGPATIDSETHDALVLADTDDETPYLISSFSEDEVMQQKASSGFVLLNFGIIATMMAGMGVAGMVVTFGPALYVTTAAISCGYLFVVLVFLYYNDLVFLRDRIDRNWSNIDVALKKRFDLIGNLAEMVQEFLGHEKALQEEVSQARQAHRSADPDEPDEAVLAAGNRASEQLIARVEAYPELKGQEIVEKMMQTLTDVEDEIALMRQGYNASVERYNTRIEHIPEVFVARIMKFERATHLAGNVELQKPVSVEM